MTETVGPPAFSLPEALLSKGFSLRPETDDDLPFLMQLFASTRADELALVPWSEEQKRAFLIQQFSAQRKHYRSFLADTRYDVLERDGVPVGRLYLNERRTRAHIVDIALMPGSRANGIGTAIITALQDYARARGKGVDIFVERTNPARSLYNRMGFNVIREEDIYLEMDWAPDGLS
ncbi:GNAT family N-acetyltransferase [Sphingomonas mali]|uniref:GNAT family N-acetyltransferase n=1 Tax=Sphingomonas mali TaxID=40682 RepID=UPI000A0314F0|nr:GNAT family N-acetyltransferase [Sphingomonas mali]